MTNRHDDSKTVTLPINLPVGPESRIGEILAAAMSRAAAANPDATIVPADDSLARVKKLHPGVDINQDQVSEGFIAQATEIPSEIRAGLAIAFLYALTQLRHAGRINLEEFRELNRDFQSLLVACCPSIMLIQPGEKLSTFNRMSEALFLDLEDLARE